MTTRPPKPTFRLTLEALPRPGGDTDGMRRLRAALKALLRNWGLKCKAIEYPTSDAPGQSATSEAGQ